MENGDCAVTVNAALAADATTLLNEVSGSALFAKDVYEAHNKLGTNTVSLDMCDEIEAFVKLFKFTDATGAGLKNSLPMRAGILMCN